MSNNQKFWRTIAIICLVLLFTHLGRAVVWQIQYYKSIEVLKEHNRLMVKFSEKWSFADWVNMMYCLRDMYALMESYLGEELGPEYFQKRETYKHIHKDQATANWVFNSSYAIKKENIPIKQKGKK